jgi:hypothetical protein
MMKSVITRPCPSTTITGCGWWSMWVPFAPPVLYIWFHFGPSLMAWSHKGTPHSSPTTFLIYTTIPSQQPLHWHPQQGVCAGLGGGHSTMVAGLRGWPGGPRLVMGSVSGLKEGHNNRLFFNALSLFRVCHHKSSQFLLCHWKSLVDFSATALNFFALHATTVRLGSNGVKVQVWKVENTVMFKYVINFLASYRLQMK